MKTCRKSVAAALLLLIHLLASRIDDVAAGTGASGIDPGIILEEVIVAGSGNGTRVTANAVAQEPSRIGEGIISLLSVGDVQRRRRSEQPSSGQGVEQSHDATYAKENDEDLERLKRVIAKYEPQRIASKKAKRKIVDSNDARGKGSTTDLERTYHEVLRNISRKAPELLVPNNVDATLNPYLSQAVKNLRQIHIPAAIPIRSASDGTARPRSYIDTLSALKNKKKSPKKYSQLNRAIPQVSSVGEAEFDSNESDTLKGIEAPSGKPRNGSSLESSLNIYSDSTEKPDSSSEWNTPDYLAQIVPPFAARSNNSDAYVFNINNPNVPSDANTLRPPSRYSTVPRPFSLSQSPNSPVAANFDKITYRKVPSASPAGFSRQQPARSSANVLPLVLPTELFNPLPTRRYVPIRRANRLNLDGNLATAVSTEANPPGANLGAGGAAIDKLNADYAASHANVITTRSPPVAVSSYQSSGTSDYYAITENPAATAYVPGQTAASYALQRQKDPRTVNKNPYLPNIAAYNNPAKSDPRLANLELALFNKFANLYSVNRPNVLNVPTTVVPNYRDFRQPTVSQQVSTLPYAPLKPVASTLQKVRPIALAKPALAPYYDSRLLVSQNGKEPNGDKSGEVSVKTNEQSRVEDADEAEKGTSDGTKNLGNYKTQINHEVYKIRKTPDERREKEDDEEAETEDRQEERGYERDRHYENNKSDKNNDSREKNENVRRNKENNKDEEDAETQEDEYANTGKDEYEHNHDRHRYNKYEYDRDDSEEEQEDDKSEKKDSKSDKPRYEKENDNRDKHDYETDFKYGLGSNNKYFNSQYNNDKTREDEEYSKRYDPKKSADKTNRQDRNEDPEDESAAEDKLRYEKNDNRDKQNDNRDKHNYKTDFKYGLENNDKYSDLYNNDKTREDEEHSERYGKKKLTDDDRYKKNRQDKDPEDESATEDKERYEKRDKQNDNRDKHDYKTDLKYGLKNNNKYSDLYDKFREGYNERYDKKKLADDNRYKKNQQDNDPEDESATEGKERYEKRDEQSDNRDKHDYKTDRKHGLESNDKHSDLYDQPREEYSERSDKKKLADDKRYKKARQDEDAEDEDAEYKLFNQPSKDQRDRRQRERQEKEQNKNNDATRKRKYHPQAIPRKDSRRDERKREEYGETNPKQVREEYPPYQQQQQQPHVQNDHQRDHRRHDNENRNDDNAGAPDHVHGEETKEHAHKHEEHHEKKKHGGNHKFEEGGSEEHDEEHHKQEGDKGDKGYKVWHENEKAEKGHHDKEQASKHYDEKKGEEKKHEEDGGYHSEHHHGEEGKKAAEFGEKGEHKKGHTTHGEHLVHKKDEFEKKTEFFDEFHEDDGAEKHGEHHHEHESKKGGHEKKAHHDAAHHEEKHGKEGKHEKGGHHHEHKGHKDEEGHEHHHDHHHKHGEKEGHEHGKKWSYKKGDGGDHKHNR